MRLLMLVAVLAVAHTSAAQVAPVHQSAFRLVSSNGYGSVTYTIQDAAGDQRKLNQFFPRIYQRADENDPVTPNLCWDAYWGVGIDGQNTWLDDVPETDVAMVDGTGIIKVTRQIGDILIEEHLFAPFHDTVDQAPVPQTFMVTSVRVTNTGSQPRDVRLFKLLNFQPGADRGNPANESVVWIGNQNTFVEASQLSSRVMAYRSITPPTRASHSTDNSQENPWVIVSNGGQLPNRTGIGPGFDRVCAFQYDLGALQPGEESWRAVVVGHGDNLTGASLSQEVATFAGSKSPEDLVTAETTWWQTWRQNEFLPSGLTPLEERIARQQTTYLKMGQVREANRPGCRPYGQLLASMPPGIWNISWVRDSAYGIAALARTGHEEESAAALNFMLGADVGFYEQYLYQGDDFGVERPYQISVCRYFGCGKEESDGNDAASGWNPNIEFDNFGLFLWALSEHLDAHGPGALDANWREVGDMTAGNLLHLIAGDNLLKVDSSAWERHLDEAAKYSYSSIMAIVGLEAYGDALRSLGDADAANRYLTGALRLRRGVVEQLIADSPRWIRGAAGTPFLNYIDGGVIEAFAHGLFETQSATWADTNSEMLRRLRMGPGRGFKRLDGRPNDPTNWYDAQEWVVIDLRYASADFLNGTGFAGAEILDFITRLAEVNFLQVTELLSDGVYQQFSEDDGNYNPGTDVPGDYQGAYPMMGFGAGAYLLALDDRARSGFDRQALAGVTIDGPIALPGAELLLLQDGDIHDVAVSDRDGRYQLPTVDPGSYTLLARFGGKAISQSVTVTAGAPRQDLTIDFAGVPSAGGQVAPVTSFDPPAWTSSQKNGVVTAAGTTSKVWTSLLYGAPTEIAWPRIDQPQTAGSEFIVTDGAGLLERERDLATDVITFVDPQALALESTLNGTGWSLTRTIYSDPGGQSLLIDGEVTLSGATDPAIWFALDPYVSQTGSDDLGETIVLEDAATGNRTRVLAAYDDGAAMVVSVAGVDLASSVGYQGAPTGSLAQLTGQGQVTPFASVGTPGNVEHLLQVRASGGPTTFRIVISFGETVAQALAEHQATLERSEVWGGNFLLQTFISTWQQEMLSVDATLANQGAAGPEQFWASAMLLKAVEDKTYRGAFIASPSYPWGADETDGVTGYRKVWGRDLYHVGTALMAIGDVNAAYRAMDYLDRYQQEADGSMPQQSLVDGTPDGGAEQLDETAAAIILAYRLMEAGRLTGEVGDRFDSLVRPAAEFLAQTGPQSQERWEEEYGYSPSTLAWIVSGMISAAEIAEAAGDGAAAASYRLTADTWEANIETWTYTTTGPLGDGAYYVRVDQDGNPNNAESLELNNGGGTHDTRAIVDGGFLDLVRFGVRSPWSATICASRPVYDGTLREMTPNGPGYYRYPFDGFGEKQGGTSYLAPPRFVGIGRIWSLLSEERANDFIARGLSGGFVDGHVAAMEGFANGGRMIPEQVWDQPAVPSERLFPGEMTRAASPLSWANAAYLKLLRSKADGRVFDRLDVVARRYDGEQPPPTPGVGFTPTSLSLFAQVGTPITVEATFTSDLSCHDAVQVELDLSAAGVTGPLILNDDGVDGDTTAGDGTYTWSGRVTATTVGSSSGTFNVRIDGVDFPALGTVAVTVDASTPTPGGTPTPTGTPSATPGTTPSTQGLLAGWWTTDLGSAGGTVQLLALPGVPVTEVEVLANGMPTRILLTDDGTGGDLSAGDGLFGWSAPLSGPLAPTSLLLELELRGAIGSQVAWPLLDVTP